MKFERACNHTARLIRQQRELCQRTQMQGHTAVYAHLLSYWADARMPFLNVYPSALRCLRNTTVDVDPGVIPKSVIHRLIALEVRTPEGCDIKPFMMAVMPASTYVQNSPCLEITREVGAYNNHQSAPFGKVPYIGPAKHAADTKLSDTEGEEMTEALRIALGVMFLAADPRYVERVLLNRDQGKDLDDDAMKRAIRRAENRGVCGYELGRDLEVSPHVRRPHFGIRWTGRGRAIPKLVPVAGSIVNRHRLTDVPTGYAAEQERLRVR